MFQINFIPLTTMLIFCIERMYLEIRKSKRQQELPQLRGNNVEVVCLKTGY